MVKSCCNHNKKDKICKRKDGKIFNLPRRFPKNKCKDPKGFTMRSSCAPYKYCKQRGGSRKRKRKQKQKTNKGKNIYGNPLEICSRKPLTGWDRSGYCIKREEDFGAHTVCAKMTKPFLEFTKSKGNNLTSVVKEGEKWCLCQNRYLEAYQNNRAPKIIKKSTNIDISNSVKKIIN